MLFERSKKRDYIKYFSLIVLSCIFITSITACGGGDGNGSPPQPPQEPSVIGVNPAASTTEVGLDTQVQATFDVAMDPATINTSTFMLSSPSGVAVNGTVSYNTATKTATFDPSYDLAPLTTYTATVSGSRDTAGTAMSDYSWSFVTVTGFWAFDFVFDSSYFVSASLAGEGDHCLIYLEDGQSVAPDTITEIVNQFDNAIYTNEILTFGEEPNPGIDGNSKVFIFLLDIRDGYMPPSGSYVAGYYNPLDEYDVSVSPNSNQKELFNMDIYPAVSGDADFLRTLAHEFQHMISWNQKTNLRGVSEDTWIDEALSEIAPLFCSYGPDYLRVIGFQHMPWDSLIGWFNDVSDYSTVYMWAQYVYDQVRNTDSSGHNVFWNINHTANVGINAVNTGLNAVGYDKDFSDVFRDWSMANYLGLTTIPGHPEWSYTSIHTEAGYPTEEFGPLPGLPVDDEDHLNASVVKGLDVWGLDYFEFTKSGAGTVTWSRTDPTDEAAFVDMDTHTVTFNMESGTPYAYKNSGILITRNPTYSAKWTETGGGTMTFTSAREKGTLMNPYLLSKRPHLNVKPSALSTLKTLLLQVSSDPLTKALSEKTGRPVSVCVHHFFKQREKSLREKLSKNN